MKLLNVFAVSAMLYGGMNAAHAGNLADVGLDDPTLTQDVLRKECRTLFNILPCHDAPFVYEEPEGDDTTVVEDDNEEPVCKGKCRPTDKPKDKKKRPSGNPGNDKNVGKAGEQDKNTGSSGGVRGASTGKTGKPNKGKSKNK